MTTQEFTDLIDFVLEAIDTNRQIATPSTLEFIGNAVNKIRDKPSIMAGLCEATNTQFSDALSLMYKIDSFVAIEKRFVDGNDKKIVSLLKQLKKSPNLLAIIARFV